MFKKNINWKNFFKWVAILFLPVSASLYIQYKIYFPDKYSKYDSKDFGRLPQKFDWKTPFPNNYKLNKELISNSFATDVTKENFSEYIQLFENEKLYDIKYYEAQGTIVFLFQIKRRILLTTEVGIAPLVITGFKIKENSYKTEKFENLVDTYDPELIVPGVNKYGNRSKVLFTIQNNNKLSVANGSFIDYQINEDEEYPLTWYMITNIHTLDLYWNDQNYDKYQGYFTTQKSNSKFTLYNDVFKSEIIETPKIVFMGFDIFKSNLNKFKTKLNLSDYKQDLEEYIDIAILEFKFKDIDQAQMFTRKYAAYPFEKYSFYDFGQTHYKIYHPFTHRNIDNEYYQYYSDQNSISKTHVYNLSQDGNLELIVPFRTNISWHFKENREPLNPYIFNRFINNNQSIINVKNKKFVDITTTIGFDNTSYGVGSSGTLMEIYNHPVIKYADYNNSVGLWFPLWWENIDTFKKFIKEDDIDYKLYSDFKIEDYNLIYGNLSNQKDWYTKSLKEINPNIETRLTLNAKTFFDR